MAKSLLASLAVLVGLLAVYFIWKPTTYTSTTSGTPGESCHQICLLYGSHLAPAHDSGVGLDLDDTLGGPKIHT